MTEEIQYNVFISYSSGDRTIAEELAIRLREAGLCLFFDRWCLPGGKPWGPLLEQSIQESASCAVLIGKEDFGPWQAREMWTALGRQGRDPDFPVIPTLLPGAEEVPSLFLGLNTWVDMRRGVDDEAAFQRLLQAIRGEAIGGPLFKEMAEAVHPYLGLRAFREEDSAFFHGREDLTKRLVEAVERTPFLAVVGPSGSGKSSVVQAGLIPALRKGALAESAAWEFAVFRPGKNPLKQLAAPLVSLLEPEMDEITRLAKVGELANYLRESRVSLADAAGRILEKQPGAERLVLVADQFEELFTYKESESEREIFLGHLLEAAEERDGPLTVILTLRADFYSHCLGHRPLADRLERRVVNIGPMTEEELHCTIKEPAKSVGVRFQAGLVERILEDVRGEPGALPLLEFALTELWERQRGGMLTHQAYEDIGRVQGGIAQRAEAEYARLSEEEKRLARRVFLRLVAPGEGTEDTQRQAQKSELFPTDEQAEAIEAVIQTLADARLVTTARDMATGEEQVDVSHEALIQGWPRLREWIDEDRPGLRTHRRLTETAIEWERHRRDESYLYRGTRLAEAEKWVETHADDLNLLEREFLQTSIALRDREERRRQKELDQVRRLVGVLILAMVAVIAAVWFGGQAESRRLEAKRQGRIVLSLQLAAQTLHHLDDQLDLALLLSLEANRLSDLVEVRGNLLDGLEYNPCLTTFLHGHTDRVRSVAFSPDGNTLASGGSEDNTIILWDVATGQPIGQPLTAHTNWVNSVAFSPDGKLLASGSEDRTIILWDTATGQPIGQPLTGHTDLVRGITFSPDGKLLASASYDGTIILWDVTARQPLSPPLIGHTDKVLSVAFSPDGKTLVSGSADHMIILWDVATGQPIGQPLTGHADWVRSVAFSPDGEALASGSADGVITLWDVATRQPLGPPLSDHAGTVWSVSFSPDGKMLAWGSEDGSIILWDMATAQPIGQPLTGHKATAVSVAFSPDGQTLASGGLDGVIILWDVAAHPRRGQPLTGHADWVRSVTFSPDGQTLASGSDDGTIILWDVAAGQRLGSPLTDHTDAVVSVALSPDGKTLASSSYSIIILWDVVSRQPIGQPLTGHTDWVRSVAFSPDGKTLASGSWDNTVILWDVATGQPLGQPLTAHTDAVVSLAFSPDGKTLASGSKDNTIILWDVTTGQPLGQPLTDHTDWVLSVAFSPDGKTLASGSADNTIILWDVVTRQPIGQPLTGQNWVLSVAFSPDDKTLASGSADGTIILWDVATRQPLGQPVTGHTDWVSSVAFSPDGKTLAAGSKDKTITLWDLSFDTWRDHACRIANRNLTQSEWDQFIGSDIPYERTCPDLPPGEGAPSDAPAATY